MKIFSAETQKQNNENFNDEMSRYREALQSYQSKLSSASLLNPSNIIQGLHLSGSAGEMIETTLQPDNGTAINGYAHWYAHNMNGAFLKVHYGDINGAYYTDMQGNTHPIKSADIVYSNLVIGKVRNGLMAFMEPAPGANWGGLDSFYIKSVDATYNFYDENGNRINFEPGTAWMFLSSLTRWANNNDGTLQTDPNQDHIEAVRAVNGTKLYNIPGGKASVHSDGNAYADSKDAFKHREPYHVDDSIRNNVYDHDGGAVLASVSNGMTLNWNLEQTYDPNTGKDVFADPSLHIKPGQTDALDSAKQENAKDGGWYYWQIRNDALSNFALVPPTRKTASVHYHCNV